MNTKAAFLGKDPLEIHILKLRKLSADEKKRLEYEARKASPVQ